MHASNKLKLPCTCVALVMLHSENNICALRLNQGKSSYFHNTWKSVNQWAAKLCTVIFFPHLTDNYKSFIKFKFVELKHFAASTHSISKCSLQYISEQLLCTVSLAVYCRGQWPRLAIGLCQQYADPLVAVTRHIISIKWDANTVCCIRISAPF
jgi:hypothetical protein